MTTTNPRKTAFISGPLFPPTDYFTTHYLPPLLHAIASNHVFVVGPAAGIDTQALTFLLSHPNVAASSITVYLAEFQAPSLRPRLAYFEAAGGNVKVEGETTGQRDAAMTRDSDYDILRYMPEAEAREFYGAQYWPRISNTEKNERRRLGLSLHSNPALEEGVKEEGRDGWRGRIIKRFSG